VLIVTTIIRKKKESSCTICSSVMVWYAVSVRTPKTSAALNKRVKDGL
jgi:hypothetical protein